MKEPIHDPEVVRFVGPDKRKRLQAAFAFGCTSAV